MKMKLLGPTFHFLMTFSIVLNALISIRTCSNIKIDCSQKYSLIFPLVKMLDGWDEKAAQPLLLKGYNKPIGIKCISYACTS